MSLILENLEKSITDTLVASSNPVLFWSGGKDSTLILSIIKKLGYDVPVVIFHQFWNKNQLKFLERVILKDKLVVYYYSPTKLNFDGTFIEIVANVGNYAIPIILDHKYDEKYCGLDIGNKALSGTKIKYYPWDLTIVGTKNTDKHPLSKGKKISLDVLSTKEHRFFSPLKDLTDDQVLSLTISLGIEYNKEVYDENNEKYDTGYFYSCMSCVNRKDVQVYCPKIKAMI